MNVITKKAANWETSLKPEVKVIKERCAGCQECIIRCPTQALSMDAATWVAKVKTDLCVGCRQCVRTCPFSSITVEGSLLVAARAHFPAPAGLMAEGDISEVRRGFATIDEAVEEAKRCLNCPDPTCVRGCPAHNNIPAFIRAIRDRHLKRAQEVLAETTCMPDVCSRVCDWSKQCEGSCSWSLAGGEPVAIGKLERFVTDNSLVPPLRHVSERGKGLSVGILGSGPAGIAAARELASAGASVTIYERDSQPGGVMQWGIPSFVLPDNVWERPIKSLADAGIEIRTGTQITAEGLGRLLQTHDAVIAAYGAPVAERPRIPGVDLEGVIDATTFLRRAKLALAKGVPLPELHGARVAVLGGSNTALDVARSVLRLGGKPFIVHRREERFSRARPEEIAEARAEGVEFRFGANLARLEGEHGRISRAVLVRTRQKNATDAPAAVKGSEYTVEVDMVVLATGYGLDPKLSPLFGTLPLAQPSSDSLFPDRRWQGSGLLSSKKGPGKLAWAREYGLRSSRIPKRDRLWLIGDALMGPSSVVVAMAQGRQAARAILEKQPHRDSCGGA